jgi:hypothetical protein
LIPPVGHPLQLISRPFTSRVVLRYLGFGSRAKRQKRHSAGVIAWNGGPREVEHLALSVLSRFPAEFSQRRAWQELCRASIGSVRWALSLALAFVLVLTLVEAAPAAPPFPSGLAERWCGTERADDFRPGWFPQGRPQVKIVYAYATDQTGQFQKFSHLIQQDIKAALEMVGGESGGHRSIAFDLRTECGPRYVDITSIPLDHPSDHYMRLWGSHPRPDGRSAAIQAELRDELGLGAGDTLGGGKRNFAVYVNIGPLDRTLTFNDGRGDMPGCPMGSSHPSCQPDDQPGPGNKANDGGHWAWLWEQLGAATGWSPNWPRGHRAMLHEITHNLGAVQDSAPNSSFKLSGSQSRAHCTDGRDIMCRGIAKDPFPCRVEEYDCNKDDYFNVNPPPGSYLDTHWNVARSVFTCHYYDSFSERGCAPQSSLFAATRDNGLWARDPVLSDINWQHIGHANDVVAMAAADGRLFAATSDNRLWARDPVLSDVNWQHIGHANNVVALAATASKLFAATSDNRLWARDPVLSDVTWQPIGHANDVVAMAGADGKLFAADRDNRLWARDPDLFDVNWRHIGHANNVVAMAGAEDYKIRMRNMLTEPNVSFVDADETCDCIIVGITDPSAATSVRQFAAHAGVPPSLVSTVLTRPIRPYVGLRDSIRPIKGGLQIRNENGAECTMTATIFNRARQKKGLLTSSHCTGSRNAVDGIEFFQPGGALFSGDFVAREVIDPPAFSAGCPTGRVCRRSDAAFAEFDTSTVGIVGRIALPDTMCSGAVACGPTMAASDAELRISQVAAGAKIGDVLNKIGRTTGWTRGTVTRTCIDVNVDGSNLTMLCQHMVAAAAASGDSGSPVFRQSPDGTAALAGILWGGPADNFRFVFSGLRDVEAELGAFDYFE